MTAAHLSPSCVRVTVFLRAWHRNCTSPLSGTVCHTFNHSTVGTVILTSCTCPSIKTSSAVSTPTNWICTALHVDSATTVSVPLSNEKRTSWYPRQPCKKRHTLSDILKHKQSPLSTCTVCTRIPVKSTGNVVIRRQRSLTEKRGDCDEVCSKTSADNKVAVFTDTPVALWRNIRCSIYPFHNKKPTYD